MNTNTRWQAVLRRDPRSNGAFVYAVRSTGVYCRPTCPSRRPNRSNVLFFSAPSDAEQAGFRPCLRCRPLEPDPGHKVITRLRRFIEQNLDRPLTLRALAAEVDLSPFHVQRIFTRAVGVSPRRYADALRMQSLKTELRRGPNVTKAIYDAGYSSSSRVYERADKELGMTPANYQRGGRGMRLGYAIAPTSFGRLLVAATGRGVSAIYLGDADALLLAALSKEYPNAEIHPAGAQLDAWVQAVVRHLEGRNLALDVPFDLQATAFQLQVWEQLRKIPYGATQTYTEVACALGRPTAARAVARACATNPVSIAIPCHRVIRGDGSLSGYRWGLDRKRALIDHERRRTVSPVVVPSRAATKGSG